MLFINRAGDGVAKQQHDADFGWAGFITTQVSFIQILAVSLLVGILFLAILLGHYRAHIHAWRAFKEGAILRRR